MIKFIVSVLLTALISFTLCLYMPWWTIAVAAFGVGAIIYQRPYLSFTAAFLSLLLLWGGLAWYISAQNDHLLARRISPRILHRDDPVFLILITALVGGLTAGFAALSGSLLRSLMEKRTQS